MGDALTFGTKKLLRNLSSAASRKLPIVEIDLKIILEDWGIDMDQFIAICILCGCDYTTKIRGIGPKKAFELIKKYKTIENGIKHLDKKRYKVPENFLYKEATKLFISPEVANAEDIKLSWKKPDEEGLIKFMVEEKGFDEGRIKAGIQRLHKAQGKSTQKRMESF